MTAVLYPGNKFGDQIGFKLTLKMFVFTIWFWSQARLWLLRAEGEEREELFRDLTAAAFPSLQRSSSRSPRGELPSRPLI